jgi:MFS family permease
LTIVTVALPSISTSLGFGGENQLQWVVNAYSLLFGGFLLFGGTFFPTLYLAQAKGYSPIQIGLAYLPWPVAMFGAGRVAQKVIARWGPKPAIGIGMLIQAGGLVALSFLSADSSYAGGLQFDLPWHQRE